MNLIQMHERLRLELLRRIGRGTLSVSLLARQTGFGQSHLSNFLHSRRHLSIEAMDRVLDAQHMVAADLMQSGYEYPPTDLDRSEVPLVSYSAALHEPNIRSASVQRMIQMPRGLIESARSRTATPSRRAWQRWIAIRIAAEDALPMEPLVQPEAVVLLDRHYNTLAPYRPDRLNIYALSNEGHLALRYLDFKSNRLVLRPHNLACPVELIELDPGDSPTSQITGRVALIVNQM